METEMKFNLIIGNPPYNDARTTNGQTNTIWSLFVIKSLELLKENGYLINVHPCGWRAPTSKIWKILSSKQIEYLEMHPQNKLCGIETGKEIFGVDTTFDFYILKNTTYSACTQVRDFRGNYIKLNLKEWPWLSGGEFDIIKKCFCSNVEEHVEYIYGGWYHSSKKEFVSEMKTNKFKYPCVRSITNNDKISYYYSSVNNKGGFGESKIIFTDNGYIRPILDMKGEYGMAQHGISIKISSEKEGELLISALKSKKFNSVVWATKWSNYGTNPKMFVNFKKDFWKYFVDGNGNEI
jgi:hypothetical protein